MKAFHLAILMAVMIAGSEARAEFWSKLAYATGEFGLGAGVGSLSNPDDTTAYYSNLALEGIARLPVIGNHKEFFEFGLILTMHYYSLTNSANISGETDSGYFLGPGAGAYVRMWKFMVGAEEDYLFARHYATGRQSLLLSYSVPETKIFAGIHLLRLIDRFGLSIMASSGSAVVPKEKTGLSKDSSYQDQMIFLTVTYTPGAGS